jgi:hypothetical protein
MDQAGKRSANGEGTEPSRRRRNDAAVASARRAPGRGRAEHHHEDEAATKVALILEKGAHRVEARRRGQWRSRARDEDGRGRRSRPSRATAPDFLGLRSVR